MHRGCSAGLSLELSEESTRGFACGFFHLTDMAFFRARPVQEGLETLFGDSAFLCRFPDDQLAVTASTAILAPQRAWDMMRSAEDSASMCLPQSPFWTGRTKPSRRGLFLKFIGRSSPAGTCRPPTTSARSRPRTDPDVWCVLHAFNAAGSASCMQQKRFRMGSSDG